MGGTNGGCLCSGSSPWQLSVFHCTAQQDSDAPPSDWAVLMMPWPAAASVFLNVFLIATLKARSYQRFGIWSLVIVVFYICYGVHSTYTAEENESQCNDPSCKSGHFLAVEA
jgi:uncharacterized membrane protein